MKREWFDEQIQEIDLMQYNSPEAIIRIVKVLKRIVDELENLYETQME